LVAANEILFLLISGRRGKKPGLLTPAYIAFLTIAVVWFFRLLLYAADAHAQPSHLLLRASSGVGSGVSSEDRLVYTHLTMVAGIFLPYLLVRLTEDYGSDMKSTDTNSADAISAERDAKAQNAVAGQ
jgi:hypothetical protein